jgi:tetratricopeptide (TPR) repeat protein
VKTDTLYLIKGSTNTKSYKEKPMSEGKIFISYRRDDASGYAGRLFDRLSTRFGEENVFMDVEGLDPGIDFHDALSKAVSACDVLIALIGKQWLNIEDENGQPRLDNPGDFVRIEIAAALDRDIRVIPVLVQNATMPGSRDLPSVLERLSRLNKLDLRHDRFNADVDRLERGIEAYLKENAERRKQEAAEKAAREKAERERQDSKIAQQEAQIADCLKIADAALEQKEWQTAQSNYRQVLELRPYHTDAQDGFQIASRQLEMARLYGQAILHQEDGHLEQALHSLRRIQGIDAYYRDVPALINAIGALIAEQAPLPHITEDRETTARNQAESADYRDSPKPITTDEKQVAEQAQNELTGRLNKAKLEFRREHYSLVGILGLENWKAILSIASLWCVIWGVVWGIPMRNGCCVDNAYLLAIGSGALGGFTCGYFLKRTISSIRWHHVMMISLGWSIAMVFSSSVIYDLSWNSPIRDYHIIFLILSGLFGGLSISVILKWVKPETTWKEFTIIGVGWSIALLLGFLLPPFLYPYLRYGWDYSTLMFCFFIGFFAGALGSWIMFWQISRTITFSDRRIE